MANAPFTKMSRRRWSLALAVLVFVLAGCTTGFNPGMAPGGRCMWTPAGPGTTNFFEYEPDCPGLVEQLNADGWSSADGWGAHHWAYEVNKQCSHDAQNGKIGLLDGTVAPPVAVGDQNSKFQTWWGDVSNRRYLEMQLKPGATGCQKEVDFSISNTTTDGLPHLHSHHEIKMYSHSGLYQTGYAITFSVPGQTLHYWLTYALAPKSPLVTTPNAPPGVAFYSDNNGDGNKLVILNASYFGTPSVYGGDYVNVDIDWNYLLSYLKQHGLWTELDVNQVSHGSWVSEFFESAGYAKDNGAPVGGVDTFQRNWTMSYS